MYAGKIVDLREKVSAVIKDLCERGLQGGILLPSAITGKEIGISGLPNTCVFAASSQSRTQRVFLSVLPSTSSYPLGQGVSLYSSSFRSTNRYSSCTARALLVLPNV